MIRKPTDGKTWLATLDRTPFDEKYHDLESIEAALSPQTTRKQPTFWAA